MPVTASIAHFPPELLATIFRYCPCERSTFTPEETLWTLGKVCRLWRQVALHTPTIWTSIYIDLEDLVGRTEEGAIALLKAVLARSGTLPLDVEVIYPSDTEDVQPYWQHLFDLLTEESNRWTSLCLDVSSVSVRYSDDEEITNLPMFHPKEDCSFDMLEELHTNKVLGLAWPLLTSALGCSPVLKKLSLSEPGDLGVLVGDVPWQQLEDLHLEPDVMEDSVSDILPLCTNLERFRTSMYEWRKGLPLSLQVDDFNVHANHIIELSMTDKQGSAHALSTHLGLSESLVLPSLQHLSLYHHGFQYPGPDVDQIMEMLEESQCRLVYLSYSGTTLLDASIQRLLKMPQLQGSLRRLTLEGQVFGHSLFKCLFAPSSSSSDQLDAEEGGLLLPHLEELRVANFSLGSLHRYDRVLGMEVPQEVICGEFCSLGVYANVLTRKVEVNIVPLSGHTVPPIVHSFESAFYDVLIWRTRGSMDGIKRNLSELLGLLETDLPSLLKVDKRDDGNEALTALRDRLLAIEKTWSEVPGEAELRICERARNIASVLEGFSHS